MVDGKYRVIKEINVYSCLHGHLKIAVGIILDITDFGKTAMADNIPVSVELLGCCRDCFVKI